MSNNENLSMLTRIRAEILEKLDYEDCIKILNNAGFNFNFKEFKIKTPKGVLKKPLYPVSDFLEALVVNNKGSLSNKANSTNKLEFEDDFFCFRNKQKFDFQKLFNKKSSPSITAITPKAAILYCLCTYGNISISRIREKTFEYLNPSNTSNKKDALNNIFKVI